MNIQEKINSLMEKEEFRAAFEQVTSAQEVVDLFGSHGVEIPVDIAMELFEVVPDGDELSEQKLEDVAGGGTIGAGIGGAIGNGIYYGAGYLGGRLAGWSKKRSADYAKSCGKFGTAFGSMLGSLLPF